MKGGGGGEERGEGGGVGERGEGDRGKGGGEGDGGVQRREGYAVVGGLLESLGGSGLPGGRGGGSTW